MKRYFQNNPNSRKKLAIVAFLLLQSTSFFFNGNSFGWSYPLKEVSKDATCRKTNWNSLTDDCKEALPIIHGANYGAYKDNPLYTTIYTTLWGAPYSNGRAAGEGAHEGVDIVSSEDTPVYAVEDGVISKARAQAGYGNVVTIKHTLPSGKLVYSIYGHLHQIMAKEGNKVKEGELIGTVGNEGFSFGNHLLFDIGITPTNTYAFWGCPEYGNGSTFNIIETIVDQGLCRDYLIERTADPIAWIESQGGSITLTNTSVAAASSAIAAAKKKMPMIALAPSADAVKTKAPAKVSTPTVNTTPKPTLVATLQKSLSTTIVQPSEISKNEVAFAPVDSTKSYSTYGASMEVNNTAKLGEDFLTKYTVTIKPSFGNTMTLGQTSSVVVTITDKNGKPFVGVLPKDLTLIPAQSLMTLSPQVIRLTNSEGKAIVLISADQAGSTDLVVSYNMKSVAKVRVNIK